MESALRSRLMDLALAILNRAHTVGLLPTRVLPLPDFLGIGTPQSGTTWLYENLSRHPELFLASRKELCFFDREFESGLVRYARNFRRKRGRVAGEISPGYCLLRPDRIHYIRKIIPDLKIFLVVRNPIDRAWSGARRVFARMYGPDLDQVPDEEIRGFLRYEHAYRGEERGTLGYYVPGSRWGNYSTIIENWTSVFPSEQLFVAFFDDIRGRPRELLSDLFQFLGISADVEWERFLIEQRINVNPSYPCPERFRCLIADLYAGEIEWLRHRYPDRRAEWT